MPIARITGQGLGAIALAVAILWACFIGERVIVHQAFTQRTQVLRELQQMQRMRRIEPVSSPVPLLAHPVRATLG
jgi:hypothetical protein